MKGFKCPLAGWIAPNKNIYDFKRVAERSGTVDITWEDGVAERTRIHRLATKGGIRVWIKSVRHENSRNPIALSFNETTRSLIGRAVISDRHDINGGRVRLGIVGHLKA